MSSRINLPINQVKLTNVAVVRMNKGGKRFEIACYKNKVVDYRQGLEKDLSEVLQTERVFTNVSKGEFAKAKDLEKVFGTKDEEEISKLILAKGQVQVSEKERTQQLEKTISQIAEWISKNCVHPTSDRPYTISQIRHAIQQANFSVHPTKPLKRQYLDCVKLLQGVIPIQRAKMELQLIIPDGGEHPVVEEALTANNVTWTSPPPSSEADEQQHQYKILVDPSLYRVLNEVIQKIEGARIEIVTQVVTKQGDVDLEAEVDNDYKVAQQLPSTLNRLKIRGDDSDNEIEIENANENENADSGSEDEVFNVSRRKQQKNSKKKNKRAAKKQREAESTTDDTGTTFANKDGSSPSPATSSQSQPTTALPTAISATTDPRNSCNTCGGSFDTPAAYRAHFKSDWHRFNQKLKLKGAAPVSEQEFLLCDADMTFFGDEM